MLHRRITGLAAAAVTFALAAPAGAAQRPVITAGPERVTAETSARFVFTGTRLRCQVDRARAKRCARQVTYRSLAEGRHVFRVWARRSQPARYVWTIDLTRPPRPALNERPAELSAVNSARFGFESIEPASCRLDAGPPQPCASPITYDGLADGAHRFAVTARDVAGNESVAAAHGWTVDTTAPAPPVIAAPFDVSAGGPGATLRCRLDGAPAPCDATNALADGEHVFSATAIDATGNESAPTTLTWTIDTTPPDAPTITAGPRDRSPRAGAAFAFTGAETFCRLDDGPVIACASPQRYPGPLVPGEHSFSVYARDAAGNRSAAATTTWTVVPGLYREAVLATPGLRAYWRLGEGSWAPAADQRGAHHGAFSGGVTLGAAGAILDDPDTAAWFDGRGGEALLPGPVLSVNATIEGWFDWRGGIAVLRDNSSSGGWIPLFQSGTTVMVRAPGRSFNTGLSLAQVRGRWHHFVLTKAGPRLDFYMDGEWVAGADGAANTPSALPWHVMNNGLFVEQYADGAADELAMYDRALTPTEIVDHYRLGRDDA